METAYFRPVNDFRSPGRAPRCKPEVDDDVMDGTATLLDESEEWAKVCKKKPSSFAAVDRRNHPDLGVWTASAFDRL